MCGRYALHTLVGTLAILFEFSEDGPVKPRFNIAPSQSTLCVRLRKDGAGREMAQLKWGLIPSWADSSIGYKLINARGETVREKNSFRSAFKSRRCLIPADGYYEWKAEGKIKQPYYFTSKEGVPFAFAGLWERCELNGQPIESCCIITTEGNELSKEIHDRMPVILSRESYKTWLGEEPSDADKLVALLRPYPPDKLKVFPVSTEVNSPKADRSDFIRPV